MARSEEYMQRLKEKFEKFVNKTGDEICNSFTTDEVINLLTPKEMEFIDREGYFRPDASEEDAVNRSCQIISIRLFK